MFSLPDLTYGRSDEGGGCFATESTFRYDISLMRDISNFCMSTGSGVFTFPLRQNQGERKDVQRIQCNKMVGSKELRTAKGGGGQKKKRGDYVKTELSCISDMGKMKRLIIRDKNYLVTRLKWQEP